jgi:hypothetical protein
MTHPTNTPQEVLWQIRQGKLTYLNRVFTALIMQERAVDMFKSLPSAQSYISYLGKFFEGIEEIQGDTPFISTHDPFSPGVTAKLLEIGQSMQGPGYNAPIEVSEQLMHLRAMWDLYKTDFIWPPTQEDLWLDHSFFNLALRVLSKLMVSATKGERELPRSAKSAKSKRIKAQGKKETVFNLYRHLKMTNSFKKMTLNAVANAIKNDWDKFPPPGSEKSPGLTTIKDYLKQDPQIMGELKD